MTQLTHFADGGTQAYGPAWSPDGRRIVWHKVGPRVNQLFIVDARGRNQRQLTHMLGDANPSSANWGVAR
jgi:Tol biopolymer transport system component